MKIPIILFLILDLKYCITFKQQFNGQDFFFQLRTPEFKCTSYYQLCVALVCCCCSSSESHHQWRYCSTVLYHSFIQVLIIKKTLQWYIKIGIICLIWNHNAWFQNQTSAQGEWNRLPCSIQSYLHQFFYALITLISYQCSRVVISFQP